MKNRVRVLGTLETIKEFPTRWVQPRQVDIWLPPEYATNKSQKFSVLYMHDGQNLFIPEQSFTKIDWGIDEAIVDLREKNRIPPTIVVGIWNTASRVLEYMPAKPLLIRGSSEASIQITPFRKKEKVLSDAYLRFIVKELKPYIDAHFRTLPDREHTCLMGSSMGGLISLYAVCEYPQVFGGAGCVSTHWTIERGIVLKYMQESLPKPGTHKFYFDHGTGKMDAPYEKWQKKANEIMRTAGYSEGKDWLSRIFPGADHNEKSWRERVHIPLEFLLGV